MRAHHHHHYNPSKNVPSSNNRLSFPSNPRNPLPLSLNINFIYTCISSDALKFRYTFLHHTQRPIERKKERARGGCPEEKWDKKKKGRKILHGSSRCPLPPFLHPRKRCSIKDNGNWKDNRTSSPCGSLSLPNAHTFAHTRETHRIEIQSGCRISDAFVVHVVGRRRRHNFRFVDENSNAEFPARFHDPTRSTQPPHHSWRTRKSPDQLSSCRGIAIDLPSSRSTVKNRFFFRKIDLLNIEMRALVLWNESFFFNYHARDLVKKRIQHLRKFESNYIFFYKINKKSLITNNEEND